MERQINRKINRLNKAGIPVIFVITGNNSSGKTVLARMLIQNLNFYQSVNLGLASKLIRFSRPDLPASDLENFDGNATSKLFKKMVDFIINSYRKTGVNIVIDGVQIDTSKLFKNASVLGGVVLQIDSKVAFRRGKYPESHFNRKLSKLKNIEYVSNGKFLLIDNNRTINSTYKNTLEHINRLLNERLKFYG